MSLTIAILIGIVAVLPLLCWARTRNLCVPMLLLYCLKIFFFHEIFLGDSTVCHDTYNLQFVHNIAYDGWVTNTLQGWNPFLGAGQPISLLSNLNFRVPIFLLAKLSLLLNIHIPPLELGVLFLFYLFCQFCTGAVLLLQLLFDNKTLSLLGGITLMLGGAFFENLFQPAGLFIYFCFPYLLFFLFHSLRTNSKVSFLFFCLFLGGTLNYYIPFYLTLPIVVVGISLSLPIKDSWHWFNSTVVSRPYIAIIGPMLVVVACLPAIYSFMEMSDFVSPTRGYGLAGALDAGESGAQPHVNVKLRDYVGLFDMGFKMSGPVMVPGHRVFFIGSALFFLVPLSICLVRRNRFIQGIIFSTIILVLLSFGQDNLLWDWLVDFIPLHDTLRHSFPFAFGVSFLALILAIGGLKIVLDRGVKPWIKYLILSLTLFSTFVIPEIIGGNWVQISGRGATSAVIVSLLLLATIYSVHSSLIEHKAFKVTLVSVFVAFHLYELGLNASPEASALCRLPNYSFQPMSYPSYWESECMRCKAHQAWDMWPVVDRTATWSHRHDDFMLFLQQEFGLFLRDTVQPNGYVFGEIYHLVDPGKTNDAVQNIFTDVVGIQKSTSARKLQTESMPFDLMGAGINLTGDGQVSLVPSRNTNIVQLTTSTRRPMELLRLENYHSGWSAYIDGVEVPISRIRPNFQAITIPEGKHEIIFRFHSPYQLLVQISTFFTILGWVLFIYWLKNGAKPDWPVGLGRFRRARAVRTIALITMIPALVVWLPINTHSKSLDAESSDLAVWSDGGHLKDFGPGKAFDKDPTTYWHSPGPESTFGWISKRFDGKTRIRNLLITRRSDTLSQAPTGFMVLGSGDYLNWRALGAIFDVKWLETERTKLFALPDQLNTYQYIKIIFSQTSDMSYVSIAEIDINVGDGLDQ